MAEKSSLCRICSAMCGVTLSLDDANRIQSIKGDRDHPVSKGYACSKGLQGPAMLYDEGRLLQPMKRRADGIFAPIALDDALDEIATKLKGIIDESGATSVAMFKGTQIYQNATASQMIEDWMAAIGSSNFFTTTTIDQSSHMVTMGRMGMWNAGKQRFEGSDVALFVGTNPLVSVAGYGLLDYDPARRLKSARQKGLKLIVIDPRRTETAIQADCFLQPRPGEDPSILAGIIRIILRNGWQDHDFCHDHVAGMEALSSAVEPFTPEYVARRAGIAALDLEAAAAMFARDSKRGIAIIGTGATMAPRSNLADHLVETLNVICGRLLRAGEVVLNPGVLSPKRSFVAEVIPAARGWEEGPKSSTGHGTLFGEKMSGILADEMLLTGDGRIRALFVDGANPAVALPDQTKAIAGLQRLDLLVAVEPFMTATALLSHYVIPPKLLYERADVAKPPGFEGFLSGPAFNQFLPAIVDPPRGSQVIDDWYLFWALAKRLKLRLSYAGVSLDLTGDAPTTEDLLELMFRDARIPLEVVRGFPLGHIFDDEEVLVEAGDPNSPHRFQIAPADVVAELKAVSKEAESPLGDETYPFRLVVRRIRSTHNSLGRNFAETRKRGTTNPLYVNPSDLEMLRLSDGAQIFIETETAKVSAVVAADPTMRRGVVSMTHCWGLLPDEQTDRAGVATSRLVRTDIRVETINAMPAMSAIPIRISAIRNA
jgi:anaerobic selenocysteine-containing dehydrogenase